MKITPPRLDHDISHAELLQWYLDAGADESIGDIPLDRFELTAQNNAPPAQAIKQAIKKVHSNLQNKASSELTTTGNSAQMRDVQTLQQEAATLAAGCHRLEDLETVIRNFEGCSLKKTASNTVFADGNPNGRLMIIGEAPGGEEDRTGLPFVGAAGQLLDKMLNAIGLHRQTDVYIANILPWRPPGNRKPTDQEIMLCLPFIRRHIELAKPDLVLLLGGTALQALTGTSLGISRQRGKWQDIQLDTTTLPAIATFHPAYILRQPACKGDVWHDLLNLQEKHIALNAPSPDKPVSTS